jgi:hypothetical protein
MPSWYYAGDKLERVAQAIAGIEERCKRISPSRYEEDIRAFVEHQLPLIYGEDEPNVKKRNRHRPNWAAEQPPLPLKYVLDAMWSEWGRAQARWGDIIRAMHVRYSQKETV